ncbi:MAG: hypothetical protein QOI07_491, partial [Verrucomicrobiota bacterium]
MAAVSSFIILKSYFPELPDVRSIAWLGLGVHEIKKHRCPNEQTEETHHNHQRDTYRYP